MDKYELTANEKYRRNFDQIFCPHDDTYEKNYKQGEYIITNTICVKCNKVVSTTQQQEEHNVYD